MAVPEVDKKLLMELQAMGFPLARATRALHYSGNSSLEDAVTWIIDHENDPDIDQMPLIPMDIDIEAPDSFDITEEVKMKAEELRNGGHQPREITNNEQENRDHESREEKEELGNLGQKSREEREKELEREREKERRRSGKQLVEAKQAAEENARKRMIALREAEKAEERRARERIRDKLEADKAERRSRHGLLPDMASGSAQSNLAVPALPQKSTSATKQSATRAELLSECLRTLKRSCKGDDAKARKAFDTLHIYVRNVINHPDQRKYRRIRLTNPVFQDRIASVRGGTRFLELCGFERMTAGQFLYLPRGKVDMAALNAAMLALQSASTNPFFGLLSIDLPET